MKAGDRVRLTAEGTIQAIGLDSNGAPVYMVRWDRTGGSSWVDQESVAPTASVGEQIEGELAKKTGVYFGSGQGDESELAQAKVDEIMRANTPEATTKTVLQRPSDAKKTNVCWRGQHGECFAPDGCECDCHKQRTKEPRVTPQEWAHLHEMQRTLEETGRDLDAIREKYGLQRPNEAKVGAVGWVHRLDLLCPLCGKRVADHKVQHEMGMMCPPESRQCPDSASIDYGAIRKSAWDALVERNIVLEKENAELRQRTEPARNVPCHWHSEHVRCDDCRDPRPETPKVKP